MKMIMLLITLVLAFLLTGCSQDVTVPAPASEYPDDALILSLPPEDPGESLPLFDYDQQAPLDIQEVDSWHESNATWYDITYTSPKGGRVPATLVVPDGRGPFAGIIVMHGMPSTRQDSFWMGKIYAGYGAVVILVDAPFNRPENASRPLIRGVSLTFTEQDAEDQIQLIVDLRRAVDLLTARPDVDPDRIAYAGLSYGGAMGGLFAGVEDRLQAYALIVGDGGLVMHLIGPDDRDNYYGSPFFMISEERQEVWLDAMWPIEPLHFVGRAAPAALLFQNGIKDVAVPPSDALRYQEAGSEPKQIIWYDLDHGLVWQNQPLRDHVEWLQQYIGEGRVFLSRPNYRASAVVLDRLLLAWVVLTAISLVFLVWDQWQDTSATWGTRLMWTLVIVILGPLGLLAYIISYRQPVRSPDPQATLTTARCALGSTTWGVAATIIGFSIGLHVDGLNLPLESDFLLFGFLFYIALPLVTGLLVFLLAWVASPRDDRHRFPFRRPLLAAIISANMVVAGGWPTVVLVVNRWFGFGLLLTDPLFWPLLTLAAIVGALVAYPFHYWMARHGAVRWEVPSPVGDVAAEPEARKPRWFEALAIALLTYVIVVAAILLTIMATAGLTVEELMIWLTSGG